MIFWKARLASRHAERKAMIDRSHDLPLVKQAKALGISRGSVYSLPGRFRGRSRHHARMDELHLDYPFAGSRMLRDLLALEASRPDACTSRR